MRVRLTQHLSSTCGALIDLFYPRRCAACGREAGDGGRHLCWDCRARFPVIQPPFCGQCGDPVDGEVDREFVCSWCRDSRPGFDKARSAVRYRGPVRDVLHAFKYSAAIHLQSDLLPFLEACVAVEYPDCRFDAVAAVPLHPLRERERTYNQSALLARGLARALRVPADGRSLRRVRPTSTQTNLTAAQRRANVRDAFEAADPGWIAGRRFLLVDDVMTTGATVDEVSRVLKSAGAIGVHVVTVARG